MIWFFSALLFANIATPSVGATQLEYVSDVDLTSQKHFNVNASRHLVAQALPGDRQGKPPLPADKPDEIVQQWVEGPDSFRILKSGPLVSKKRRHDLGHGRDIIETLVEVDIAAHTCAVDGQALSSNGCAKAAKDPRMSKYITWPTDGLKPSAKEHLTMGGRQWTFADRKAYSVIMLDYVTAGEDVEHSTQMLTVTRSTRPDQRNVRDIIQATLDSFQRPGCKVTPTFVGQPSKEEAAVFYDTSGCKEVPTEYVVRAFKNVDGYLTGFSYTSKNPVSPDDLKGFAKDMQHELQRASPLKSIDPDLPPFP